VPEPPTAPSSRVPLVVLTVFTAFGILAGMCIGAPLAPPPPPAAAAAPAATTASGRPTADEPAPGAPVRVTLAPASAAVTGPLRAPGGPYLYDHYGRVVSLHGVNAVYKHPPFTLTVTANRPNSFTARDASQIASLGFNVVRLGILWQGLEPGHGSFDNPAVCTPGKPHDPHMFDAATARAYLGQVGRVVDLLGHYHVYTILDMHQDVFNQLFGGEGAPDWAVCTDGQQIVKLPGRWSRTYGSPTLAVALHHFWTNDVVGNLQGQFDKVWATVARYFAQNQFVVGYDPYNEPFDRGVSRDEALVFATNLQCFYTGRSHPGSLADTDTPLRCPANDPVQGVIPAIENADPHHLVFVEPDIYSLHGRPNLLGPMDFPRLVLNLHVYCGDRSPVTGDPTNLVGCVTQELTSMLNRERERPFLSSVPQPGGPAWFMSEFGATHSAPLLDDLTGYTDLLQLGWAYWSWKYYDDPTGSSNEALAGASGDLAPTADVLSRAYAMAVAGTPISTIFDPGSGSFQLVYASAADVHAPTLIFLGGRRHYPSGYCAVVHGGTVTSARGAPYLTVLNRAGIDSVQVTVNPGACPTRGHRAPSTTTTATPTSTGSSGSGLEP